MLCIVVKNNLCISSIYFWELDKWLIPFSATVFFFSQLLYQNFSTNEISRTVIFRFGFYIIELHALSDSTLYKIKYLKLYFGHNTLKFIQRVKKEKPDRKRAFLYWMVKIFYNFAWFICRYVLMFSYTQFCTWFYERKEYHQSDHKYSGN